MKNIETKPRFEVIDVLRGFALLGVLLVHISGEFAGWSSTYSNPLSLKSLPSASLDSAVNFAMNLIFVGKARALFAFLFGVGFFFLLGKAQRLGHNINSRFTRRMFILFVIGVFHAYLLWSGDIFRIYAVCGLLLLLVYKLKPAKLLFWGIILTTVAPAVSTVLHNFLPYTSLSQPLKEAMYQGYASRNYSGLIYANILRDIAVLGDPYFIGDYLLVILGNFMLGYWAAQTELFARLAINKILLRRSLFTGLFLGLFLSPSFVRVAAGFAHATESSLPAILRNILALPYAISKQAMALFLMCSIIYLYYYGAGFIKKVLQLFIPVGRMTLTNYLMHSVLAVVLFDGVGFGLISHFGPAIAVCIGLLYFALQMWYSAWWLKQFTMGPMEFIWRSMLDGKWQQIRHLQQPVAAVVSK